MLAPSWGTFSAWQSRPITQHDKDNPPDRFFRLSPGFRMPDPGRISFRSGLLAVIRGKYNVLRLTDEETEGQEGAATPPRCTARPGQRREFRLLQLLTSLLSLSHCKFRRAPGLKDRTEVLSPNEAAGTFSAQSMPAPDLALDLNHRIQHSQQPSDRASCSSSQMKSRGSEELTGLPACGAPEYIGGWGVVCIL